ncbi:aminoglycoside phosphotransferase family protein [Rhodalgimonas zhirmunskyi]|uniref:Phosphotransferase n=1 Tax=Rhodalgimonas zhirmunskyi TaxID=2964767 RepID=A0AAJ1X642_9RHOB|nr:phosphotransferase [Rhodoalgimonas zhirmunskyi]MDQ2094329.1 phosphotransferase [Rhodoalgimonas zhirmunskyi]
MTNRDALIPDFLDRAGWGDATVAPLAGDASNRRYLRLRDEGKGPAVLMDAPPEKGEDVRPFIAIADHLYALGLSAPRILARDENAGFLLLEDLGDDLFARVIPRDPTLESTLYEAATDLLITLHHAPAPTALKCYSPTLMAEMAALAYDWYLAHSVGPDLASRDVFLARLEPLLKAHASEHDVLIQRDYHAENLLWLPDRDGVARVGLLDFQDAMSGHRAYDLVSLLQDARRDVPPALEREMLTRYIRRAADQDPHAFERAYHLLGAQRNLRILGVFTRLCIRDGKAHYVDLIPRVWGLLQRDLDHPALAAVAPHLRATLPEPTQDILDRLKQKCATAPKPQTL